MLIHASDRTAYAMLPWLANNLLWPLIIAIAVFSAWLGWRAGVQAEKIQSLQAALKEHSFHDAVTGLPNRTLFMDRVRQQIRLARRNGQTLSVCTLNLDRFSNINELLGPDRGDELLRLVGERLQKSVRESDTVARLNAGPVSDLLNAIEEARYLMFHRK